MEEITAAYVRRLLPRRDPMGHKGTFGKVLCVCGSVGFSGAAVFAGRAAVRTGSGLVYLGVPEPVWPVAAMKCDEAMPFPLPSEEGKLSPLAEEAIRQRAGGEWHLALFEIRGPGHCAEPLVCLEDERFHLQNCLNTPPRLGLLT